MTNFLHTFEPSQILISFGPVNIYWYGFFIVLGIISAMLIAMKLAPYYGISKDTVVDLAFILIISGIIGARFYDVLLNISYYLDKPLDIFKVWQGGLAIHGALIAGAFIIWRFVKKNNLNFWILSALIVPGLALGQAIGRWGNYFNQELFGVPTGISIGIPISPANRPAGFASFEYFHPTFLYESLGDFFIFLYLVTLSFYLIKKNKLNSATYHLLPASYLILYSLLRFITEFIRIDETPVLFGLRFPQWASLAIIIASFSVLLKKYINSDKVNTAFTI